MKIDKYLDRIHYNGPLTPNLDLLKQLQRHHLLAVPFENLDIHYKKPIALDVNQFYDKIVHKNRGGFCYELNGLFYELLVVLGFDVKRISARVYDIANTYSPEYDHLAIIVKIDDVEYLTDVGFGDFIFEPLKLQLGEVQHDPCGDFIIDVFEEGYWRVSEAKNDGLKPVFIFKNLGRKLVEFNEMCQYHQTNPNSHFMKKRLISMPTKNGRITISGNMLKIKEGDKVTKVLFENEQAFERELRDKFNVMLE